MNDDSHGRELGPREYLRVLGRRWWVVVLSLAVVMGAAGLTAVLQDPVYSATAEVLIPPSPSVVGVDPGGAAAADDVRSIQNEIELIQSDALSDVVPPDLRAPKAIQVGTKEGTDVLTFTTTGGDPERTAAVANAYADGYLEQRSQREVDDLVKNVRLLQTRIDELKDERTALVAPLDALDQRLAVAQSPEEQEDLQRTRDNVEQNISGQRDALDSDISTLQNAQGSLELSKQLSGSDGAEVITRAVPASSPISPNIRRSVIVGAVLGLLVGVGLAFLFERIDDSIKSKVDLESASGTHALGLIPRVPGWKERSDPYLVSVHQPTSPAAESYRTLRTSLQFLSVEHPMSRVLFTSSGAMESKTTTVANLAVAIARSGHTVIAVGGDLRRPRLQEFFDVPNTVGFTTVLLGDAELDDALQDVPGEPRLQVLASGAIPPNPSELLSAKAAQDLLVSLSDRASIVLIDSPPVLPVTDALVLSSVADATILVAASGATTKRQVSRAVELLSRSEAPVVGTVLSGAAFEDDYGVGYGYQGSREPAARTRKVVDERRPPESRPDPAGDGHQDASSVSRVGRGPW